MKQFFVLFAICFATQISLGLAMQYWSKGAYPIETFDVVRSVILAIVLAWLAPKVRTVKK